MNQADFDVIVKETITSIARLLAVKGREYASNHDRLANFKRGASLTGCTPLQVAFIYAAKHFDGIASYVKDPSRPSSEPIEGRFDDLINYCILMKAIVIEERGATTNTFADIATPNILGRGLAPDYRNPAP